MTEDRWTSKLNDYRFIFARIRSIEARGSSARLLGRLSVRCSEEVIQKQGLRVAFQWAHSSPSASREKTLWESISVWNDDPGGFWCQINSTLAGNASESSICNILVCLLPSDSFMHPAKCVLCAPPDATLREFEDEQLRTPPSPRTRFGFSHQQSDGFLIHIYKLLN